jgi:hypothetical protein
VSAREVEFLSTFGSNDTRRSTVVLAMRERDREERGREGGQISTSEY